MVEATAAATEEATVAAVRAVVMEVATVAVVRAVATEARTQIVHVSVCRRLFPWMGSWNGC